MIHYIPPEDQLSAQKFARLFCSMDRLNITFRRDLNIGLMHPPTFDASVHYNKGTGVAWGGSNSDSKRNAAFGAMGEAIERYGLFMASYDLEPASFLELQTRKLNALDPESFTLYAQDQETLIKKEVDNLRRDTVLPWTWFQDALRNDRRILVPSLFNQFIYGHKPIYCEASTNGNGCGQSPAHAKRAAVLELLERDAIMFYWWTKNSPLTVDLSQPCPRLRKILAPFADLLPRTTLLYTKTDFDLPTLVAVFQGDLRRRLPMMAMSGGSGLDPFRAIDRALSELRAVVQHQMMTIPNQKSIFFSEDYDLTVWDYQDHVALYAYQEMKPAYEFLLAGEVIHYSELPHNATGTHEGDLEFIVSEFHRNNHRLYFGDLTPRHMRAVDLHIYRSFSPDLIEVDPGHKFRALGVPRFYQLPQKLALRMRPQTSHDLNPFPHPFP